MSEHTIEESYALVLHTATIVMRPFHYLRMEILLRMLRLPYGAHLCIGILHTCHWEELIILSIHEKHRLGACQRCHVGIVKPASNTWDNHSVCRAAFILVVGKRHKRICGVHPAHRNTGSHLVRKSGSSPGTMTAHAMPKSCYLSLLYKRQTVEERNGT